MKFLLLCMVATIFIVVSATGCAHGNENPVNPGNITLLSGDPVKASQTHLWGYYDVHLDIASQTTLAVVNRSAMFAANVVTFLNSQPASLAFKIYDAPVDPGGTYLDVDIDVKLTHPFPGLLQYNGYDVRGIFIGNGSKVMAYNSDLRYAEYGGLDQVMYDYNKSDPLKDPFDGLVGMPDGYTRWWNPVEFANPSTPLLGYTQGKAATKGYSATATLNPYKYFADGLSADGDLWDFMTSTDDNGVFSSGKQNVRNYYLRFPTPNPNVKFAYAVVANWKGPNAADHPANAPEAVALSVTVTPDVYYVSPVIKGGKLILDISVFDWDSTLSAGIMEDYNLIIESTVLSSPSIISNMTPTGGGQNFSTYHVEIPANNITGLTGNEFWVIVEDQNNDYTNTFGVINQAGNDKLAACYRFDLTVLNELKNTPPEITGITDNLEPAGLNKVVSPQNTAVTYIAQYTDPDAGQTHNITWYIETGTATDPSDPPDTMPYNWASKALGAYKIWVKVDDGFGAVQAGPFDITNTRGWAGTWGAAANETGQATATDAHGNVYSTGFFQNIVDFDPGPANVFVTSKGSADAFLSKFDSNGTFLWVRTWGGLSSDIAHSVAVDPSGNVFVSGEFQFTADFDPGAGIDNRNSNGERDGFLSKFDSTGNYLWALTWGASFYDVGYWVTADDFGNAYLTGHFNGTVDMDPGPGEANLTSNGANYDVFLSKFNSSGAYQWARGWGGLNVYDTGFALDTDPSGNVYITGLFAGTNVDFDPGTGITLLSSAGLYDVFLSKFNPSGNFIWARGWGGTSSDRGYSLVYDSSGSVYVTGTFRETADFDPGPANDSRLSNGLEDIFLSKFDSSGNYFWARAWGAANMDNGYGVHSDFSGNVFVVGSFQNTVDFDPGPANVPSISAGLWDCYMSVFYQDGSWQWVRTWGGSDIDTAKSIAGDSLGNVFVTGMFGQIVDFDPGPDVVNYSSQGFGDIFLIKFLSNGYW